MSISDCDRSDYISSHWTSSDTEHSFSKMSSEDSLDKVDKRMDSDSDIELNLTANMQCDQEKSSISESDLELNLASDIHSADSSSNSAITHERNSNKLYFNSKMDSSGDEIPNLMDDDDFIDGTDISDNEKSKDNELLDEADDDIIMKQLEKLIIRRNKKDNEARL
ncbi:unnamed protein product, partial [Onchocerca ochengi]|uniref:Dentin sialophosphoprotein-like n=1 Tax=Onchocerca ochengi TaxID=42157 RepID=A0A182EXK1_ONCOC